MSILQNVLVDARAVQARPPVAIPAGAAAPTLGKAFSPAAIARGGTSTLTPINTNGIAATLTASLVDTPPAGLVVSGIASPAGMIPANGSRTVTVNVNAAVAGN